MDRIIRPYLNGKDLTGRSREVKVIDLFGMTTEEVQEKYPAIYQWVVERVKPERDQNNRESYRRNWWIFGEPRSELRSALKGLTRYIATTETEKHRTFEFLSAETAPDNMLVCVAHDDACVLGVLSSRVHTVWAPAAGGWLGVGNDPRYTKTRCFDPFPFPAATEAHKHTVRAIAERLNSFRRGRLAEHKTLTITKLYNVLEKLRRNEPLSEAEKAVHEMGLVTVLKEIHDELDAAVADAYGWPNNLTDEQILEKLVALNRERAAEERRGQVRWLRPEFQMPKQKAAKPAQLEAELVEVIPLAAKPLFPKQPADQVTAVRAALAAAGKPIKAGELARRFKQGKRVESRVGELLEIMAAIGQAHTENGSRYFSA